MRCILSFIVLLFLICVSAFAKAPDSLSVGHLEFVPNYGQFEPQVLYQAKLRYGTLFVEKDALTVALVNPAQMEAMYNSKVNGELFSTKIDASAYRIVFENSLHSSQVEGLYPYEHYYNYFNSSDRKKWASRVFPYPEIVYHKLYDGVDLRVFQSNDNLKYEFYVTPQADPSLIHLRYDGIKSISLQNGNLIIHNHLSQIIELSPIAYQISGFDTLYVDCKFRLKGNALTFVLGSYDPSLTLVIDPTVVFSSFSGSTADNWGYTATYDSQDHLYGGGIVFGIGYPISIGAYQVDFCGTTGYTDVGISKFSVNGNLMFYSTYLGGGFVDIPHSLHVNDNDELYILGTTGSPDFPVTPNAFDTSFNAGESITLSTSMHFPHGADIFVSKLSTDGTQLLASTFVGGSDNDGLNTADTLCKNYADDNRGEIIVDENSDVYVVSSTRSVDFPVTAGAYCQTLQGDQDICIFKMSQNLSQMIWATYLGGSEDDAGYSMMLCDDHSLYVTGGTCSSNMPVSSTAHQTVYQGKGDGFVAHFSPNGMQLLHATYIGTPLYDQSYLIKGDKFDNPYVFGQTDATDNSWIQNVAYYVVGGGQFLTKLHTDLSGVQWSTAFGSGGGGPDISPTALSVDYCKHIYMSGWGSAALNGFGGTHGLPITSDAFQVTTDGSDYYFICLDYDATGLIYGSFFGGSQASAREHVDGGTSRFNKKGCIYQAVCAGCGGQSSFPTTANAWSQTNNSSNCNLGVIKMDFGMPVVVADFTMPHALCAPDTIHFVNHSQTIGSSTTYFWDFGDGTTSTQPAPSHFYNQTGSYTITLIVQDNGSCNFADTMTRQLLVLSNSEETMPTLTMCEHESIQIGLPPATDVSYQWITTEAMSDPSISNPMVNPDSSCLYILIAQTGQCSDTLYQWVNVENYNLSYANQYICCEDGQVTLSVNYQTPPGTTLSVDWSLSPTFASVMAHNVDTLVVSPDSNTVYYVRLSGPNCEVVRPITVYVSRITLTEIPYFVLCFEEGITLDLPLIQADACSFYWSFGDGNHSTQANPYVAFDETTPYTVVITNQYGCQKELSGLVVRQEGTFDYPFDAWCDPCSVLPGETAMLFATQYGQDYSYQWSPQQGLAHPDSASTTVDILNTTTFTVQVTDTFLCSKKDTVTIEVVHVLCDDPYVFVPNLFTPNGDGQNDVLYVRSIILGDFYFAVYSRWGEKVFETTSKEEGWDGTYKGHPCQNGVYDFYLKGNCVDGQEVLMKGNVTLVR